MSIIEIVIAVGVIVAIGWAAKNHLTLKQIEADFFDFAEKFEAKADAFFKSQAKTSSDATVAPPSTSK